MAKSPTMELEMDKSNNKKNLLKINQWKSELLLKCGSTER